MLEEFKAIRKRFPNAPPPVWCGTSLQERKQVPGDLPKSGKRLGRQ